MHACVCVWGCRATATAPLPQAWALGGEEWALKRLAALAPSAPLHTTSTATTDHTALLCSEHERDLWVVPLHTTAPLPPPPFIGLLCRETSGSRRCTHLSHPHPHPHHRAHRLVVVLKIRGRVVCSMSCATDGSRLFVPLPSSPPLSSATECARSLAHTLSPGGVSPKGGWSVKGANSSHLGSPSADTGSEDGYGDGDGDAGHSREGEDLRRPDRSSDTMRTS